MVMRSIPQEQECANCEHPIKESEDNPLVPIHVKTNIRGCYGDFGTVLAEWPKDKRKKYDKAMLETAHVWARQSYAKRLQVGAILAIDGRIIMTGYNGTVSGSCNVCETEDNVTKMSVIHAEANAILFCAKKGIRVDGATLFVTHSPCVACAALIAQAGIVRVVYDIAYRDASGLNALVSYGISVERLKLTVE